MMMVMKFVWGFKRVWSNSILKRFSIYHIKICGENRFIFQKSTKNQKTLSWLSWNFSSPFWIWISPIIWRVIFFIWGFKQSWNSSCLKQCYILPCRFVVQIDLFFKKAQRIKKHYYHDCHEISRLLSESESPQSSEELSSSSGDSKLEEE